jgi:nicotinate-nucleotide adenylyltransferase
MKVGLFGGAFNPIHRCHLVVAESARERLGLTTVLFIPTGDPPHKPSSEFIASAHRLAMLKLAIAPYPYFQASEIEMLRPNKSYSIDTIRELRRRYPLDTELVFIIGLDAFRELPSWKEPDALLSSCDFAVVARPGSTFESLDELAILVGDNITELKRIDAGEADSIRLPLKSGRVLWAIRIPPCNVSAKDIRNRLRHGQNLENALPPSVESYYRRIAIER